MGRQESRRAAERAADRVAERLVRQAIERLGSDRAAPAGTGGTCHCDGPPHQWSPGWCPEDGPVA